MALSLRLSFSRTLARSISHTYPPPHTYTHPLLVLSISRTFSRSLTRVLSLPLAPSPALSARACKHAPPMLAAFGHPFQHPCIVRPQIGISYLIGTPKAPRRKGCMFGGVSATCPSGQIAMHPEASMCFWMSSITFFCFSGSVLKLPEELDE